MPPADAINGSSCALRVPGAAPPPFPVAVFFRAAVLAFVAVLTVAGVGTASQAVALAGPAGPRNLPGWPVVLGNGIHAAPAVGDLDGDGRDELAVGVRDGRVFLLDGQGGVLPGWPRSTANQVWYSPLLLDLSGDGTPEILASSADGKLHAWFRSGDRVPGWPVDLGGVPATEPTVLELPGAANPRILVGCLNGTVHQFDRAGAAVPGWPVQGGAVNANPGEAHPLQAGDLDLDGVPEILWLCRTPAELRVWDTAGVRKTAFERVLPEDGLGVSVCLWEGAPLILATTRTHVTAWLAGGRDLFAAAAPDADAFSSTAVLIPGPHPDRPQEAAVAVGTYWGSLQLYDLNGAFLPGWPRRLGGFVFGLAGASERYVIRSAPLVWDLNADGLRELVVSSYDQHLYGLEFDGTPLLGWPVTLDDAVVAPAVTAELDGRPGAEIVVGQLGESLYAFGLQLPAVRGAESARSPAAAARAPGEWPARYTLVLGAAVALAFMAARPWPRRRPAAGSHRAKHRTAVRFLGLVILAGVLIRGLALFGEIRAYVLEGKRLESLSAVVGQALAREQTAAAATAGRLAASLDSLSVEHAPSLYGLERLADRARLDYGHTGLMVVDRDGQAVLALGLARGYAGMAHLGMKSGPAGGLVAAAPSSRDSTVLVLDRVPVVTAAADLGLPSGARLLVIRSLLDTFPQALADATGSSVLLSLSGTRLAGADPISASSQGWAPWLGRPQPSRDVRLPAAEAGLVLDANLAQENFPGSPWSWFDLGLALLAGIALGLRWDGRGRAGAGPGWMVLGVYAAVFLAGRLALGGGEVSPGPVPMAGYWLEVALQVLGLAGATAAIRSFIGPGRLRRLSFALLGSYLVAALLPLSLVLVISANLLERAQRRILDEALDQMSRRADNILMAYMGNWTFRDELARASGPLMDESEEAGWFNFVGDDQLSFTYDLPSAYLTLAAWDPRAPERHFSGYSYRAPRHRKFFARPPAWTGRDPWRGVVLEHGVPEMRAGRLLQSGGLDVQLTSHLPLDQAMIRGLEERLRILPFLPQVRLEAAWLQKMESGRRQQGWDLPLRTRLVIPARDWRSGTSRGFALEARAVLPGGRESGTVIATLVLLALLPLGLSGWGAWFTMRRTVSPLSQLLRGIRRVQQGDLDFRLGDAGSSEVAVTGQAFDHMAASLQRTVGALAEKKKVEEVSALKSRFISMVSHDLKTPLAAIQGAAENVLAEVTGPLTPEQARYLQMILSSSGHLQGMIADILDLSRIESGGLVLETETLDIRREAEALLRSLGPLLDQGGLTARVETACPSTQVTADRTRLWQILNNLLANAVRHSPRGGAIVVRIGDTDENTADGMACLSVRVQDQGPGIPVEDRARVLEPFTTGSIQARTGRGAGLGLAIVNQLVVLHGGRLRIADAPGGGASLEFTLPRAG